MSKFLIIFIYFFLDRSLSGIYYLQNDIIVNQIYTGIGKIIGLYYFITTMHLLFEKKMSFRYLGPIIGMMLGMLISTIINDGSISRCLQTFYPIFFMVPFLYTQLQTKVQACRFLDAISSLYLFLAFINLVQACLFPYLYSDNIWAITYFFGGENHVQYPLMVGLLFNLLNQYVNGKTPKTAIYIAIHITSTIIVFSATSLVACFVCIICIFCKPITVLFSKMKMKYILYASSFVFFIIVCLGGMDLLESNYVAPIIELLGKDSTLSGRTNVWKSAMLQFMENPILGSGFSDNGNMFDIWSVGLDGIGKYITLSAHNQFLQTLVEGGVVAIGFLFVFILRVGNYLDKVPMKLSVLIKSVIVSFIILLMGEAGGWYNIWFVSIMGTMFCNLYFVRDNMQLLK